MNADRTPRWPAGTVGSISHTTGFAGAVAATTHRMRSIGIDIEIVGRVTTEIEPRIFTGRESAFLASLSAIARNRAATAIFSAKEAFYKCQYPLTGAWLDFSAVWLELNPDDATSEMSSGTFTVDATQVAPDLPGVPLPLTGRFAIADGFALTGVALDRAHPVTTPVGASPIP
jgi:4'-phosphopantetheinyl transferase EntD